MRSGRAESKVNTGVGVEKIKIKKTSKIYVSLHFTSPPPVLYNVKARSLESFIFKWDIYKGTITYKNYY